MFLLLLSKLVTPNNISNPPPPANGPELVQAAERTLPGWSANVPERRGSRCAQMSVHRMHPNWSGQKNEGAV